MVFPFLCCHKVANASKVEATAVDALNKKREPSSKEVAPHLVQGQPIAFEVTQITTGPKHHLFGYIGQSLTIPWNESGRYIVAMRTNFFKRMPKAGETADIVIIDTANGYKVTKVDTTQAWNLQKGTMLYWNPNAPET